MADFEPNREPLCPPQSQPVEAPPHGDHFGSTAVKEMLDEMQAGAPDRVPREAFEGWPQEPARTHRFTESVSDLACIAAHQLGITLSRTDELMARSKEFINSKHGVAARSIGVVAASGAAIASVHRARRQRQERPRSLLQRYTF